MKNFREMPVVKVLLVALVVLFVWGVVVPEGALARVQMRDGHEGDPGDSYDFIGGGASGAIGGGGSKEDPEAPSGIYQGNMQFLLFFPSNSLEDRFFFIPVLPDDCLIFEEFYYVSGGGRK